MSFRERIQGDVKQAMRDGERERVNALRLVLSELLKAEKEGEVDELAVMRRERKRRLDAASAFGEGGRDDLAAKELEEAELISSYLPAELSEQELGEIVERAIAESGATSPAQMGAAMKLAIAAVAGRADGKRVSSAVKEQLSR